LSNNAFVVESLVIVYVVVVARGDPQKERQLN